MKSFTRIAFAAILILTLFAVPTFAAEDAVVKAVDHFVSNLPSDWFQMKPEVLLQKLDLAGVTTGVERLRQRAEDSGVVLLGLFEEGA